MATSTPELLRNRIATLITALAPTSDPGVRFLQSRDESAANFPAWCEANPAACLRRFQVRSGGARGQPDVSNVDVARHEASFVIRIAYPNTHRYGGGRDRDDVMDEDFRKIDVSIGLFGRANFSSTNDCTPLGLERLDDERDEKVSFLSFVWRALYVLSVSG